jgi:uncharacterized protein
MSSEENKRIAVALLENMSNLKIDAVVDALADDARWRVLGGNYFAQGLNRNQFRKTLKFMASGLPKGLNLKISRVIAEGDSVVVEAEGNAPTRGNKTYNNHYVWILTFRGGKVVEGTEYMDTLHVLETFGPILRPKERVQ